MKEFLNLIKNESVMSKDELLP
jgi:FAT domain